MEKEKEGFFKKHLKTFKKIFVGSVESVAFMFRTVPGMSVMMILTEIIRVITSFVYVYIWQWLINSLTYDGITSEAWLGVAVYIGVSICFDAFYTGQVFSEHISYNKMKNKIRSKIMKKTVSLDIGKWDDPDIRDAMSVAKDSPDYFNVYDGFLNFLTCLFIAGIAISQLIGKYPFAVGLTIIFYLPSIFVYVQNDAAEYKLFRDADTERRKSEYYKSVITGKDTAMEVRLYGYGDLFRQRFIDIWKKIYTDNLRLRIKHTVKVAFVDILSYGGFIATVAFMVGDIVSGNLSAGDAAFYLGLARTLMNGVRNACYAGAQLNRSCFLCDGRLNAFFALETSLDESGTLPIEGSPSIEFRNVSFKYPGKDVYVLKNVSFKVEKGEKLALVGINGAGKTTLTKLLCRFYDPTEGEILFNGIPAKEYDINALRGLYGVLFQKIQMYYMSMRENVMLSDIQNPDEDKFLSAMEKSGADSLKEKLANGYDTELMKQYGDDNYEPSGGEKQKIGIARAWYKDASVIIFDEPSSALDAQAEDKIFSNFVKYSGDKTAFLISHRLSAVSMADRVVLLEGGEVKEIGTHDELISLDGRYAELYNMQAEGYKKGVSA